MRFFTVPDFVADGAAAGARTMPPKFFFFKLPRSAGDRRSLEAAKEEV